MQKFKEFHLIIQQHTSVKNYYLLFNYTLHLHFHHAQYSICFHFYTSQYFLSYVFFLSPDYIPILGLVYA